MHANKYKKNKSKKCLKRERDGEQGINVSVRAEHLSTSKRSRVQSKTKTQKKKKICSAMLYKYKCPVNTISKLNIVMITVFLTHTHQ